EGSWDFNDHTALPKPRLIDDQHGTRCAGEIAAAKNDLCGLGVAYGAKVAGLRILSGQITDVDEAAALNYNFHENHIYSCSWGPPDDGQSMDAPKGVVLEAMINGIKNGRNGKGSIYVFATGNGGGQDDDCNFDGYTNSLYTVSIGAIDRKHQHPYYSEACSAQLAVTYSNGGGSAIYTCDVGERKCFSQHGGTSAAAPIAAGMIALMLSIRPDLTWRDVQYLLMTTAIPIALHDPDWKPTAAGRMFNHKFGYGNLDAYALVEASKTFQPLGTQTFFWPAVISVEKNIGYGAKGISSVLTVTDDDMKSPSVKMGQLEHITVTVNIEHQRRGDVEVILTSPNRVESKLGARRRFDLSKHGFVNWTFMTVKHWGESPIGDWTLTVRDQSNPSSRGKFIDWRIKFWGEIENAAEDGSSDRSKSDPTKLLEDEQILNETETPIILKDGSGYGGDNAHPPAPEVNEQGDPSPVKESDSIKSKVNVEDTEKELDIDPSKTPDGATTTTKLESDPSSPEITEGDTDHGDDEIPSLDQTKLDQLEDAAKDAKIKAEIESKLLKENAAELNADMSHTFYIFIGVIGLGSLIVGYMTKHKWDGRGRYTSIREGILGARGRNGGYGREVDEIDLLPRTIVTEGGRPSRAGRTRPSRPPGNHPRQHRRGSSSRHQLYDVGEVDEEQEDEEYTTERGQQHPRLARDLIPSLKNTDEDALSGEGSDSFAVGSDTDDEDFLSGPSRANKFM
ncbi:pheromone processing endoprotease, partial [Gryganskiella cystojenkinii]